QACWRGEPGSSSSPACCTGSARRFATSSNAIWACWRRCPSSFSSAASWLRSTSSDAHNAAETGYGTFTLRMTVIAAAAVFTVVATATIAGARGFELIGGLQPCPLRLQQRWAYYAAIPLRLAAVAAAAGPASLPVARMLLGRAAVVMVAGAGLAVWHAGIEWGWWQGPTACSAAEPLIGRGRVLPGLDRVQVVRCDEAAWR